MDRPAGKTSLKPPVVGPDLLDEIVRTHLGCEPVYKRWRCDVLASHAGLISEYNDELPVEQREVKFMQLRDIPTRLADLLWEDFDWLAEPQEGLRAARPLFSIVEIDGASPDASIHSLAVDDKHCAVIAMHGSLIQFINSGFSKIWCLTHQYRHAGCLPKYAANMESELYSDATLLAALFNDVETLYVDQRRYMPFQPPHIADPYDYCDRAQGARRFILAHEIAHAMFNRSYISETKFYNIFPVAGDNAWAWAEEFWCDSAAMRMINDRFLHDELAGPPLYELEGALLGALTFMFLFSVIEVFLRAKTTLTDSHPTMLARIDNIRFEIKQHPNYARSPQLRATLDRNWARLNSFRDFCARANDPFLAQNQWDAEAFRDRLSPFGNHVCNAMFKQMRYEYANLYQFDAHLKNDDQLKF